VVLLALAWASLGGCSKPTSKPPAQTRTVVVVGKVTDQDSQAVGRARIRARVVRMDPSQVGVAAAILANAAAASAEFATEADGDGFFALEVELPDALDAADLVLLVDGDGHVATCTSVPVTPGGVFQRSERLTRVGVQRFVGLSTGTVLLDGGGAVRVAPDGLLDDNGAPLATATISATVLRLGDPEATERFPGDAVGVAQGAGPSPLRVFGVIDVAVANDDASVITAAGPAALQLEFPFPSVDPQSLTVPMWRLDPDTARWVQEGTANLDAARQVYVGGVSAPGTYALATALAAANLELQLTLAGRGVSGATVRLLGDGVEVLGSTGHDGRTVLEVPADETVRFAMLRPGGDWHTLTDGAATPAAGALDKRVFTELDGVIEEIGSLLLTWSGAPNDLDLHLSAPTTPRSHIYFDNRGSLATAPYAFLDSGDVTGTGPELITFTRKVPGFYRCAVHNASGQAASPIEGSFAEVRLLLEATSGRSPCRRPTRPTATTGRCSISRSPPTAGCASTRWASSAVPA